MSEQTPVTRHVHECVKLLNERLQTRGLHIVQQGLQEDSDGFEAVFELVDAPWDELAEGDELFREGYETCMVDVCDAIAMAWGIELPKLEVSS